MIIAAAAKGGSDEMRKYPSPAYISYLTSFKRMGVPAPNGKWWGHRREKRAGQKFMDSRSGTSVFQYIILVSEFSI